MTRRLLVVEPLYWHCAKCGGHDPVEPTEPPYERGDMEKCITCGDGFARVMTLKEAAKLEQGIALGMTPRQAEQRALDLGREK